MSACDRCGKDENLVVCGECAGGLHQALVPASAQLIAAAPELLKALKALVAWADYERPDGSLAPAALAHAAIKKAEQR
jgi:hypothetical protein